MKREIWYFMFALGVILFTWPVLTIFRNVLPAYFFIIWLVYIVLIFIIVRFSKRQDGGD